MEVGALSEWGGGITGSSESESVCSGPSEMTELMNPGSGLRLQPGSGTRALLGKSLSLVSTLGPIWGLSCGRATIMPIIPVSGDSLEPALT